MNKAVFLDRDGTINIDYGYVYEIDKFKFIPGVIEALKILNDLGYILIIITNQSGIGRKYFTEEQFNKLNNYMLEELKKHNINISKVYYCPHIDSDNCQCRKPKLELFYKAVNEFNIDLTSSYVIGDKERDLSLCNNEKVKGILLTNESISKYICKPSLLEAAKYIESTEKAKILRKDV